MFRRSILISLVLFFTSCVIYFVGKDGWHGWLNLKANHFRKTEGVIRDSRKEFLGGAGMRARFHLNLAYTYSVAGTNYVGHRVNYSDPDELRLEEISKILARFPVGAPVSVFYNSADPSESIVLHQDALEVLASGALLAWFGIPLLMLICSLIKWSVSFGTAKPAAGLRLYKDNNKTEIYLPEAGKITFAIAGFWLGLTISGTAAIFFAQPSNWETVAVKVIFGIVLITTAVIVWRFKRDFALKDSLIIDHRRRKLALPQTFGRKSSLELDFDPIDSVRIEPLDVHTKLGNICLFYILICYMKHGQLEEEKIALWCEQELRAETFADWLLLQLNQKA